MTAQEKLSNSINKGFHICVGLDTDFEKIPEHLKKSDKPILNFNKSIIEATAEHACAFKVNFAFYECLGKKGIELLEETIDLIPESTMIIADAKRGDIGNTSKKYAQSIFEHFKCDSATLHPYMGADSISPFLEYADKINFILGLTSNPSSIDFEKQKLENGNYVYQEVIKKTNQWNENNNCGIVFGATNLDELKNNINLFDQMPILLPGVGAQGGSLEDVVKVFNTHSKRNYLINISRGLIYFDSSTSFNEKTKERIINLNEIIANI